ncbi:MAG TPA: hypothetical protein VGP07_18370 [Polyangia bacterium]|jgi:adenosylhomocysteine nucleosidase
MTVIVAAMPEEMAVLRARLTDVRQITTGAPTTQAVTGRLGGRTVTLAVTGDGERQAREGIAAVLAAVPAARLLVLGLAGGLSRDLRAGELVIAERIVSEAASGADTLHAERTLIDAALRAITARPAVVVTANRIADSVAEKQRLLRLAAAPSAVVDLESAGYARAAVRAGIPWIVLRAVSDTADEALPALLNRSRDEGGAVRRGRVVRGLLGELGALPVLLSLRRRLRPCAEALARAAEALVAAPPDRHAASDERREAIVVQPEGQPAAQTGAPS